VDHLKYHLKETLEQEEQELEQEEQELEQDAYLDPDAQELQYLI
jgi:hypothetical protein